ncbi:unnamed protein product [Paramecium sonneborni]|uniref:Uncharacterized protein n=1 Tax=Paramecium sonneborni TaxID=65129 RepID=A0A8S1R035_9CILI|nr:unnamed protein product [Paramecium sonneborni]
MNPLLTFLKTIQCHQGIQEYEIKDQVEKLRIQIITTGNNKLIYNQNGVILRVQDILINTNNEQIRESQKDSQILTTMDQIKYLKWKEEYGQQNNKISKWTASWQGQLLQNVGGYFNDGLKQGMWKELTKNYQKNAQVYYCGYYFNNLRRAEWQYVYSNKRIGGGFYNNQGQKTGKWTIPSEEFWELILLVNIKMIKKLDYGVFCSRINICKLINLTLTIIRGGGQYDNILNSMKIGTWMDVYEDFSTLSQIIDYGQYKDGKKVGRWDILFRRNNKLPFELIGGGVYDDKDNTKDNLNELIKIDRWIELSAGFQNDSQIIYNGVYKNGKKIGRWDILFKDWQTDQFTFIGGGLYDEIQKNGCDVKIGRWNELSDQYNSQVLMIYDGQYKYGKKVGQWDTYILQKRWKSDQRILIGGGLYDDTLQSEDVVYEVKIGKWIELSCGINRYFIFSVIIQLLSEAQIIYNGEYKNGRKVGRWDLLCKGSHFEKFQQIGGGEYEDDRVLGQIKIGKWIELRDNFESLIIFEGEYQNGNKVGRWDIYFQWNGKNKKIGGGFYDKDPIVNVESVKVGKWIEASDLFSWVYQVTFIGEYKNDKKIGTWEEVDIRGNFKMLVFYYSIKIQQGNKL